MMDFNTDLTYYFEKCTEYFSLPNLPHPPSPRLNKNHGMYLSSNLIGLKLPVVIS